jgi:NADPH2:quinone reductase
MRAAWYTRYGPAREVFVVGEMPTPTPGHGEVLVRVHASGVNPSDYKSRLGSRGAFAYERIVPHSDGAGVIEAVGPGVSRARVGQRVWLYEGQWQRPLGTAAEYIALPSHQAVPLADALSFAEGACIGIPAMTAHRCLFADGPVDGATVLVTGGAGAVGHYAIQLARWAGAGMVIATVSGEAKAAHALAGGADHAVNYRTGDPAAKILELTDGQGVDRIVEVDFGGNLPLTERVLAQSGAVASYASTGNREPTVVYQAFSRRNATFRLVLVYSMPLDAKADAVDDITDAIAEGALWHPVGARYALEDIAAAHEAQEQGAVMGNIVIELP